MRTSIIFATLGLIFLASACDGSLRVHPVHVDERVDVNHRDHHDNDRHDNNDHHEDHR